MQPASIAHRRWGAGIAVTTIYIVVGVYVSAFPAWLIASAMRGDSVPFITSASHYIHALNTMLSYPLNVFFHFSWAYDSAKSWLMWSAEHEKPAAVFVSVTIFIHGVIVAFIAKGTLKKVDGYIHIDGLKRIDDEKLGLEEVEERFIKNDGVTVHPSGAQISKQAETYHFCYAGIAGAGKTQALQHPMRAAIERGDKLMIHDFKGDFVALFNERAYETGAVVLLDPQDARTSQWCMARDTRRRTDPELLAETLIKGDPDKPGGDYWVNAGKDVLAGVIASLRAMKGDDWTWGDFTKMFSVPLTGKLKGQPILLQQAIMKYRQGAAMHLMAAEQASGVVGNIRSDMQAIDHLAFYWNKPGGFSIRDWMRGEAHKNTRVVIIKCTGEQKFYRQAVASMFAVALNTALSFPEGDARFWLFLDELAQLPMIPDLAKSMFALRSKGARIVIGSHGAAALNPIYGEEGADAIMSQTRNKFFGIHKGEEADKASKWFGDVVSERRQDTIQANQKSDSVIDPSTQTSSSYQREETKALPGYLLQTLPEAVMPTKLQKFFHIKTGPTMYCEISGLKNTIVKLFFPYIPLEHNSKFFIEVDEDELSKSVEKPVDMNDEFIEKITAWLEEVREEEPETQSDSEPVEPEPEEQDTDTGGHADTVDDVPDDIDEQIKQSEQEEQDAFAFTESLLNGTPEDPRTDPQDGDSVGETGSEEVDEMAEQVAEQAATTVLDPSGAGALGDVIDLVEAGSDKSKSTTQTVHHDTTPVDKGKSDGDGEGGSKKSKFAKAFAKNKGKGGKR